MKEGMCTLFLIITAFLEIPFWWPVCGNVPIHKRMPLLAK
jgi:hypothetical protein